MEHLIGYDSAAPHKIPDNAKAIFPYADGLYAAPWQKEMQRFKHAKRRHITVFGNAEIANIYDIEKGDGRPYEAPGFIDRWRAIHGETQLATIYCSRSTLFQVLEFTGNRPFHIWLATLDGSAPTEFAGRKLIAVQYNGGMNAPYDKSVIYDSNWMLDGK